MFACRFVDRSDFEYVEMDTDSEYMALSGESLESVVRPEMKKEFFTQYGEWFPRLFCPSHKQEFVDTKVSGGEWSPRQCCADTLKFDTRTPGLFKVEFEGDGIVALNSKKYFRWSADGDSKYSSKGRSKRANRLTKDCFLHVMETGVPKMGVNKGFVRKDNQTYTSNQLKTGLTYFYAKIKVCDDGVSTVNIDL